MEVTKYIQEYFQGERKSALLLLGISFLVLVLSYSINLYVDHKVAFGLSAGLAFFSGLHILVSLIKWGMAKVNERKLTTGPDTEKAITADWQRMKTIVERFPKVRRIQEIIFGLAFIAIFLGIAKVISPISMGFAMAVLFQAAVLIAYDLFAQRRAEEYERRLGKSIKVEGV